MFALNMAHLLIPAPFAAAALFDLLVCLPLTPAGPASLRTTRTPSSLSRIASGCAPLRPPHSALSRFLAAAALLQSFFPTCPQASARRMLVRYMARQATTRA